MHSPLARALAAAGCVAALAVGAVACAPSLTPGGIVPEADRVDRERYARHQITNALSFRAQGRLESAEQALGAALAVTPENARAHRLMSVVLADLGRLGEAEQHRARADALDPPPPLPPDRPLVPSSRGVLVVIPPPEPSNGRDARLAGGWPGGEAVTALLRRLRTRLPEAEMLTVDPESVAEVQGLLGRLAPRAVLSLRLERAWCGDSEKDGPFSVAWLRVAAGAPGETRTLAPGQVRHVEWIPPPQHCVQLAVGRALETALAHEDVQGALGPRRPGASAAWPAPAIRALFPGLSLRIAAELDRGRARLATGRVAEALVAFRRAAEIDAQDGNVQAYLQEAELTVAMARELSGGADPAAETGDLEPQLTEAQRAAAEQLLADERQQRDQLLAALLVLDSAGRAPPLQALGNLRSAVVEDPGGPGGGLARTLSDAPLEVRAYFGPDGAALARYWFAVGGDAPVLREADGDGDGVVDRWDGYVGGARRHVWEDRQGLGRPDLHMTFDPAGEVERIEVDGDLDGSAERVFAYRKGVLASEARDTDDDGHLDRTEHFDAEGFVTQREEDLDADGESDITSFYERGTLVRREITNPELVDELLQ